MLLYLCSIDLVAFGTVWEIFDYNGIDNKLNLSMNTQIYKTSPNMTKQNKSRIALCHSQKYFGVLYLLSNLKLTFLECENINSTAIIKKLEYAKQQISGIWEVSPRKTVFFLSSDLG